MAWPPRCWLRCRPRPRIGGPISRHCEPSRSGRKDAQLNARSDAATRICDNAALRHQGAWPGSPQHASDRRCRYRTQRTGTRLATA
ncbi:hypothetical protein BRN98_14815, partial [Xanthomonas oryzae pv. oryzae]